MIGSTHIFSLRAHHVTTPDDSKKASLWESHAEAREGFERAASVGTSSRANDGRSSATHAALLPIYHHHHHIQLLAKSRGGQYLGLLLKSPPGFYALHTQPSRCLKRVSDPEAVVSAGQSRRPDDRAIQITNHEGDDLVSLCRSQRFPEPAGWKIVGVDGGESFVASRQAHYV